MHLDQQVPTLAYIVPRSNDMIIGGVAQEGNWNTEATIEDRNFILDKGLDFFKFIDPLDAPVDAVLNLF